jgi:putative addiction module CopG family antidote
MNVTLGKLEQYVKAKVRSGCYLSEGEVVREALRRMQATEDQESEDLQSLMDEAEHSPVAALTRHDWAMLRKLASSGRGLRSSPKAA